MSQLEEARWRRATQIRHIRDILAHYVAKGDTSEASIEECAQRVLEVGPTFNPHLAMESAWDLLVRDKPWPDRPNDFLDRVLKRLS
jgi:hypothetical protein